MNTLSLVFMLAALVLGEHTPQSVVGDHGERSVYQITEGVWRQHMGDLPFEYCTTRPATARECARRHVHWIQRQLARASLDAQDPRLIALVWNAGWTRFHEDRIPRSSAEFAEYVTNLYRELERERTR